MRFRLRTLLIVSAIIPPIIAAFGANFLSLPLRDHDDRQAASQLVAWIVEEQAVPGFGEEYVDARLVRNTKQYFVICDFVPSDVPLSTDPRVRRISEQEYKAAYKEYGYDDTAYIWVERKTQSRAHLTVDFSIVSGDLGGHGYRFEFRRKLWGLRATGQMLWVS